MSLWNPEKGSPPISQVETRAPSAASCPREAAGPPQPAWRERPGAPRPCRTPSGSRHARGLQTRVPGARRGLGGPRSVCAAPCKCSITPRSACGGSRRVRVALPRPQEQEEQGLAARRWPWTCPESRNETGPLGAGWFFPEFSAAPQAWPLPGPFVSGTLLPGLSKGLLGNWGQGHEITSWGRGFPNPPIQAPEAERVRASLPEEEAPSAGARLGPPTTPQHPPGEWAGGRAGVGPRGWQIGNSALPGPLASTGLWTQAQAEGEKAGIESPWLSPGAGAVLPKLHLPTASKLGNQEWVGWGQWDSGWNHGLVPWLRAPSRQPAPCTELEGTGTSWSSDGSLGAVGAASPPLAPAPHDATCPLGPVSPAARCRGAEAREGPVHTQETWPVECSRGDGNSGGVGCA